MILVLQVYFLWYRLSQGTRFNLKQAHGKAKRFEPINKYISACGGNGIGVVVVTGGNGGGSNGVVGSHDNNGI